MAAPSQRQHTFAGALVGVPAAETSTHTESASASHRGASASLLDQVGGSMAATSHRQTTHLCRCLGCSAGGRDEHAHRVRLRLAPRSSRKLARPDWRGEFDATDCVFEGASRPIWTSAGGDGYDEEEILLTIFNSGRCSLQSCQMKNAKLGIESEADAAVSRSESTTWTAVGCIRGVL